MLVIETPQKIWQPRVINKFKMPDYPDIDDGVFDFKHYGKCVYKPSLNWDPGKRDDIISYMK